MIKASKIQALTIPLKDGGLTYLVQDGAEWNGLCKFKCIAPAHCEGFSIIAIKDPDSCSMSSIFADIFSLENGDKWLMVMATPGLIQILASAVQEKS